MTSSFYTEMPEGIILTVKAQPRASRSGLDSLLGDALKVRIKCAPVDGKANKELIETLSDAFDLPKSKVIFKGGETSKNKRILLEGLPLEQFLNVLKRDAVLKG